MDKLQNKKVAIIATDGVEEVEYTQPLQALKNAGAETVTISEKSGEIKAWNKDNWGQTIKVDKTFDEVSADDFDSLFIPGGVMNPDKLRMNQKAVDFARQFLTSKKPLAAICHGPQILIETRDLGGRTMTSYPSLKTDLENAGVNWVDKEVVVDQGITTSRSPKDLDAFCKKMIEEIGEGKHQQRDVESSATEKAYEKH